MAGDVVSTVYGPMSAEFAKSPLGDLCVPDGGVQTGPFGSQLHASDYVKYGTPIITVEHLGENRIIHNNLPRVTDEDKKRLARYTLITGDIVFSRVGSVDRRAIVHSDENGWLFSGRCLRVRPDREKIDPGYLSWFFGLPGFREYVRQIAVGATMPSLNTTILSDVPIYYPRSLKEQQAIGCILGALDDKIELNRRMNRTLEKMAAAIFKSWFIDFDPVRAKAEGRELCLPKEIADLFPDSFEDSKIGPIPKGWKVTALSKILEIIGGGTPKTTVPDYWNGSIPWFAVGDAPSTSDVFVIDTEKHVTELGIENSSTKLLEEGATIISARGTVGKCALVGRPMAMNQSCYGIRGVGGRGNYFMYYVIRSQIADLQRSGHGSVFNTITRGTFNSLSIADPGPELSFGFEDTIRPFFNRVRGNCFQNQTLSRVRDALLPKLLSGELEVPGTKTIAGECV